MKIEALVKFNNTVALVLPEEIKFTYYRKGNLVWGTDGLFYNCYYHKPGSTRAFAGREFTITLHDGEVIECKGDYWDGGYNLLEEHLGIKLVSVVAKGKQGLKDCYVFSGMLADKKAYENALKQYEGIVYPYRDYEKVLNFDDVRRKGWDKEDKLKKDKKHLVKAVKEKHKSLENTKNLNTFLIDKIQEFYNSTTDIESLKYYEVIERLETLNSMSLQALNVVSKEIEVNNPEIL